MRQITQYGNITVLYPAIVAGLLLINTQIRVFLRLLFSQYKGKRIVTQIISLL
jgi:hypothetical protein